MGRLRKQQVSRPLPAGAEIVERRGERIARWRGKDGRTRTASVSADGTRVTETSSVWRAIWTDADGRRRSESTGCKDKTAAQAWLAAREREVELERAGVVTAAQVRTGKAARATMAECIADYLEALRRKGTTESHRYERRRYLAVIAERCGFETLRDLDRTPLENLLAALADEGLSARTRNVYRASALAFANWLLREARIVVNPFSGISAASERVDRRRERRALTDAELTALLEAAERRPLHDATHGNRGDGAADLTPETVVKLERLGRERRLVYLAMVSTGLRRGELAAVRICDVDLDATPPCIHLPAKHEKARRGADVALTHDLADALRSWIADKRRWTLEARMRIGAPEPLADDAPLFEVPSQMTRIFDHDLAFAGISKRDARGRTVDVHALRTTLGTRLARAGVPLQVAQRVLRHSTPELTANIYTALDGGDIADAIEQAAPVSLPVKADAHDA